MHLSSVRNALASSSRIHSRISVALMTFSLKALLPSGGTLRSISASCRIMNSVIDKIRFNGLVGGK
jgi:hypothetical protein